MAEKNKQLKSTFFKNKITFEYDIEKLKDEILDLKRHQAYDRAMIRLLKIQLYKASFQAKDKEPFFRKTLMATSSQKSSEDLIDEINKLKQTLHEKEHEFKIRYSRVINMNAKLTKILNSRKIKFQQDLEKNMKENDNNDKTIILTEKEKEL